MLLINILTLLTLSYFIFHQHFAIGSKSEYHINNKQCIIIIIIILTNVVYVLFLKFDSTSWFGIKTNRQINNRLWCIFVTIEPWGKQNKVSVGDYLYDWY